MQAVGEAFIPVFTALPHILGGGHVISKLWCVTFSNHVEKYVFGVWVAQAATKPHGNRAF